MKIDRIASSKVQVQLNEEDMKTLNMSFPAISWENESTRDIIQGLLDIAGEETGFSRKGEKLLIEVFEPKAGECCFVFTLLPRTSRKPRKTRYRVVRPSAPVLYRFEGAEELLDAMYAIARRGIRRKSRSKLYRHSGKYDLIVYPSSTIERGMEVVFMEFGEKRPCPRYHAARLQEHGTLIADGDVIRRMAGSFLEVHN